MGSASAKNLQKFNQAGGIDFAAGIGSQTQRPATKPTKNVIEMNEQKAI